MSFGTHAYVPDDRNGAVLFNVNGKLVPRDKAVVNVFDSGFMLGDGVWEGLRVHQGRVAFLQDHLDRLWEGAAALDIDIGLSKAALTDRLYETLTANDMTEGVHIRLMLTRGLRSTPYQDPRVVISEPTIVIAPEFKTADPAIAEKCQRLYTVSVRRGRADVQDPGLNSHSKINCVTACIQAIKAGADEGLMLDPQGFVATCNSTHFFIVSRSPNVTARMKLSRQALLLASHPSAKLTVVKSEQANADPWSNACNRCIWTLFIEIRLHDDCHVVRAA